MNMFKAATPDRRRAAAYVSQKIALRTIGSSFTRERIPFRAFVDPDDSFQECTDIALLRLDHGPSHVIGEVKMTSSGNHLNLYAGYTDRLIETTNRYMASRAGEFIFRLLVVYVPQADEHEHLGRIWCADFNTIARRYEEWRAQQLAGLDLFDTAGDLRQVRIHRHTLEQERTWWNRRTNRRETLVTTWALQPDDRRLILAALRGTTETVRASASSPR